MHFKKIYGFILFTLLILNTSCKEKAVSEALAYFDQAGVYQVAVLEHQYQQNDYRIYYPENYTERLPVLVWGNGTDAQPDHYDGVFKHLASHGFLVIDTYEENTGTGKEIHEAINTILAFNKDVNSPFFNTMDTLNIALAGHSQGSTGVINTYTNFNKKDYIKTIVSIALPALYWCDPEDTYNADEITVPFLIMGGTKDYIISPTRRLLMQHLQIRLPCSW